MVDEPAGDALTGVGVLAGVQDDGVPADVDQVARAERIGGGGAGGEDGERLIHDPGRQIADDSRVEVRALACMSLLLRQDRPSEAVHCAILRAPPHHPRSHLLPIRYDCAG